MTIFVDFVPSTVAPFSFSPTLAGQVYNCTVTWALFGARYYINLKGLDGSLVVSEALVGSPTGKPLQALSWAAGRVQARVVEPHGYKIGRIVGLTISGAAPDAYNGLVQCTITGPSTFTYPLASAPGPASAFGMVSWNLNLVGAYFPPPTSLVFRAASQQFEVLP